MDRPRANSALLLLAAAAVSLRGAASKSLIHQPAVIHLDFGETPLFATHATSNSWVYPRSLPRLPEERAIFCTNSRFPEDTFCEVGVVIERDFPDQFITEVNMTYPHPSRQGTACSVRLDLDEENYSKARLKYRDFRCEPEDPEDTDVPPFKMSDVEHMTIRSRKYENENYVCWHEFKNVRFSGKEAVEGGEDTYEEPNVKFVHDGISCISAISFTPEE